MIYKEIIRCPALDGSSIIGRTADHSPLHSINFEGATSPSGAIHLDPRGIDHLWPEQSGKRMKRPYL